MNRNAKYYMLYVDYDGNGFAPQFGDKSRAVVVQEMRDSYRGERCRIEAFWADAADNAAIERRAAFLNRTQA